MLKSDLPIQIIADDRERKSDVIEALAGFENVDVTASAS